MRVAAQLRRRTTCRLSVSMPESWLRHRSYQQERQYRSLTKSGEQKNNWKETEMNYLHVYTAEETQEQRLKERLDQAATYRLARQLRPRHRGWLSARLIRFLHWAGYRLLAAGAQPEPSQPAMPRLIEGSN